MACSVGRANDALKRRWSSACYGATKLATMLRIELGFGMRIALNLTLLLTVTISQLALGQEVRRINTCFEESLAALLLSQLEQGIAHCDQVIEDKAATSVQRGQAYAQRGLMHARRWSIMSTTSFAVQGIGDISEALRLYTPPIARKHQLLIVRAVAQCRHRPDPARVRRLFRCPQ